MCSMSFDVDKEKIKGKQNKKEAYARNLTPFCIKPV